MSYKIASYIVLLLIVLFGIGYGISINSSFEVMPDSSGIGPSYFPNILLTLLIILCIISFFQTVKKQDQKIPIPNLKYIIFTIIITVLFLLSWQIIGLFYVNTFVFIYALVITYRLEKREKIIKMLVLGFLISILTTLFIWILFDKFLTISM